MNYKMMGFREFCYNLYKVDWLRRISADDQIKAWQNWYDNGCDEDCYNFNGEKYASYSEFLDNEFLDKDYMRTLLNDKEYEWYSERIKTATIILSNEKLNMINTLLSMTGNEIYDKYGMKRDETITHTAKFDNDYFMDIKLVICDGEDKPYTEAVLFDPNGNEITCSSIWDEYNGLWILEHECWSYQVNVISQSI